MPRNIGLRSQLRDGAFESAEGKTFSSDIDREGVPLRVKRDAFQMLRSLDEARFKSARAYSSGSPLPEDFAPDDRTPVAPQPDLCSLGGNNDSGPWRKETGPWIDWRADRRVRRYTRMDDTWS